MKQEHTLKTIGFPARSIAILLIIILLFSIAMPISVAGASNTIQNRTSLPNTVNVTKSPVNVTKNPVNVATETANTSRNITPAQRTVAASNFQQAVVSTQATGVTAVMPKMDPGGVPHYFGPYPNYANSPMPKGAITGITVVNGGSGYSAPVVSITDAYYTGTGASATAIVDPVTGAITGFMLLSGGNNYTAPVVTITDPQGTGAVTAATISGVPLTGGIRKFVDGLPGIGAANANNLGQYIPVAIPDTTTYPGSDYYVIELGQYTEKLHTDLQPTTLRGYRQVNTNDPTVKKFSYLGPLIVAQKDRPVCIKFINNLPTGAGGNLFLPVDTTLMGAGMGPLGMNATPMNYTQNRATLHLHGGLTTWISDGTTEQWTTPAGEKTPYPEGVSVYNVPDMDNGTEPQGTLTFYYSNEQSARLMFYHDHAAGITRLNVYAGEVAGYLLTDRVEQDMINGTNVTGVNPTNAKVLPDIGIPLIIQDKTFVDPTTIAAQDPTWNSGTTAPTPHAGDLWYPHVYMPNQNPYDPSGANAFGRWDYAPWFWPPVNNLEHGPTANPYYDPANASWEPPLIPATPNPSAVMEAYMDTPLVNGAAYPNMTVDPKAYRFRILNGADDRFFNLQLYVADPNVTTADGRKNTEVKMVPAIKTPGYPANWPSDGRDGGVPDPATAGPSFIQIGTEGGFLPAPVVIPNQPITWNYNMKTFNFGNVKDHALLLGTAERADVIVDFSQYAGKTLILYNDAPAAFPSYDPRNDYYTNDSDQTGTGGAPQTQPGYGPNTRTIMQIHVASMRSDGKPIAAYNLSALQSVFAKTATKKGVFEVSQPPIIVSQSGYNSAYNAAYSNNAFVRIQDDFMNFSTISGKALNLTLENKAIHDEMGAAYDTVYGRGSALLGIELTNVPIGNANALLYPYYSPPVDIIVDSVNISEPQPGDGTQIWKISHNGIDDHTLHFHLFNVQVINRVAWDGTILPPDPNELGWKDTVRINPLETTIVALRPVAPANIPFDIPNSVRAIDPTMPLGTVLKGGPGGFVDVTGEPVTVINRLVNYGWEYVFHCHVLGHEELDMMHSMVFAVAPKAPTNLTAVQNGTGVTLTWKGNSLGETGFTIQRANDVNFTIGVVNFTVGPHVTTYTDSPINRQQYYYRVQANNLVGDTTAYAAPAVGFPHVSVNSVWTAGLPLLNASIVSQNLPAAMYAGNSSTVSVTMRNTGILAWTGSNGFALGGVGGTTGDAYKFGITGLNLPAGTVVRPGQTYTWTFRMTAPYVSGNLTPKLQMVWGSNAWFGETVVQTINVTGPQASYVSSNYPDTMLPGQSYAVSITMRNNGTMAWPANSVIKLGNVGNATGDAYKFNRYPQNMNANVNPGGTYTFNFVVTAPTTPGTYHPAYQMIWQGQTSFGDIVSRTVVVGNPNANIIANTIPSTMRRSTRYTVNVTVLNTGNVAWTSGTNLGFGPVGYSPGVRDRFGVQRMYIPSGTVVLPGQSYNWTFVMTAPARGSYPVRYQMVWTGHMQFGNTLSKTITVR